MQQTQLDRISEYVVQITEINDIETARLSDQAIDNLHRADYRHGIDLHNNVYQRGKDQNSLLEQPTSAIKSTNTKGLFSSYTKVAEVSYIFFFVKLAYG